MGFVRGCFFEVAETFPSSSFVIDFLLLFMAFWSRSDFVHLKALAESNKLPSEPIW